MKRLFLLCILVVFSACKKERAALPPDPLKNGDIIFHASLSNQSRAIQLATHSEFSHCGIVFKNNGQDFVFEAVQPVKTTPLAEWIARGEDGHYVVKRLKDDSRLTPGVLDDMRAISRSMNGKDYDLYFEWSDERIYCSELVWKIYKDGAGIELGHLQKLSDFDLSNPVVKEKLQERYGDNIPMDEKVISPAGIFKSNLLKTVVEE